MILQTDLEYKAVSQTKEVFCKEYIIYKNGPRLYITRSGKNDSFHTWHLMELITTDLAF
jgi:hypothetical protein